jgi:hypothetical protein
MKKLFISGICILLLSSCSTSEKSLYSWYNYVDSSYKFDKRQDQKSTDALLKDYQKIIAKQKGIRQTVPPGIYAENGYMLIKSGKKEEGLALLKKEVELYPESNLFIERIIKQLEK